MKKITLGLFLIIYQFSFGQVPSWSWAKNISKYSTSVSSFSAIDNEGNIYLIGDFSGSSITVDGTTLTNLSQPNNSDIYILKYDTSGTLLWAKSFGGNSYDTAIAVATDQVGNFYLVGSYIGSISFGAVTLPDNQNSAGTFYAKFDSNGNVIWAKGTTNNDFFTLNAIKTDLDGNIYMAGNFRFQSVTFDSVVLSNPFFSAANDEPRPMVLKLNSNGNCIWARAGLSQDYNVFGSKVYSVAVDNNGGVAISGVFSNNNISFGTLNLTKTTQNNLGSNMFVIKYDSNGTESWGYNAGSIFENNTSANTIKCDSENNVIIAGFFTNSISLSGTSLTASSGSQFFLAKYNETGILQWAKSPSSSNGYTSVQSIDLDLAGNIYCAGMTYASLINFGNGVALSNIGNTSLFVSRYNSNGNAAWAKSVGGLDANNSISIACKTENEMYISGTFNNASLTFGTTTLTKNQGNIDLYLAKLYYAPLGVDPIIKDQFVFFPNPFKDVLNIENLKSKFSYTIFNILGEEIQVGTVSETISTIDLDKLATGVYVIKMIDNNGITFENKIIKE